ncbi:hypothetical protein EVAR_99761_1 [Eumeta japonica]|uniref:DUF4219 domain-containing protein n=1 Tax=Eumeta variegata TaxID=151549 RepID=A0A4C1ZF04_EUMVA|nr:hypothetical protein EVAR_99761_1 [Eumeta japonica]
MATATLQIEKLAGQENYSTWKFAVKSYLELDDLRECIDPGTEVHLENATSSKQVWQNLQNAFENSWLSRKFGLLKDLINTPLDNCPSIEQYVNKIMSKAHKLRNIGFEVGNERLGTHMLAGLLDIFKPMTTGLENSGIKISSDFIKQKLCRKSQYLKLLHSLLSTKTPQE